MPDACLVLPGDFDAAWTLGFLWARAVPGLEFVHDDTYVRSITVDEQPVTIRVQFCTRAGEASRARGASLAAARGRCRVRISTTPALEPRRARALVGRLLGLNVPLAEFHALIEGDAILGRIVRRRPGLRLPQFLDPFEALVRAIVGQQVSVAGARTMAARIVERFGNGASNAAFKSFPTAAALADSQSKLIELGFTRAKAAAVHHAARAAIDGTIDWDALRINTESAQSALEALPGVGPWTASYVRMRGLGDRDAFPASDLGVLKALSQHSGSADLLAVHTVRKMAEAWRPWRAYAVLHLWAALG